VAKREKSGVGFLKTSLFTVQSGCLAAKQMAAIDRSINIRQCAALHEQDFLLFDDYCHHAAAFMQHRFG